MKHHMKDDTRFDVMRKLLHTRNVVCQGYQRDDGLWDIEGRITDVKAYDRYHADGTLRLLAGQPQHLMTLTLTVNASLVIVAAQACTLHAPHAECKTIESAYVGLVGLRIGPGFIGAVKKRFRGALGCTHITELLGPVATTAIQTLAGAAVNREQRARDQVAGKMPRPAMLDSCYALRSGGEVARRRWPFYVEEKPAS